MKRRMEMRTNRIGMIRAVASVRKGECDRVLVDREEYKKVQEENRSVPQRSERLDMVSVYCGELQHFMGIARSDEEFDMLLSEYMRPELVAWRKREFVSRNLHASRNIVRAMNMQYFKSGEKLHVPIENRPIPNDPIRKLQHNALLDDRARKLQRAKAVLEFYDE